ncbi:MAG: hypothetical protein OEV06_02695 [Anaerolineae bacterium]|nr:hypothetical protein [Anaerolineae bacterium]
MNIMLDDTLIYEEDEEETRRRREQVGLIARSAKWLSRKSGKLFQHTQRKEGPHVIACECQPCG